MKKNQVQLFARATRLGGSRPLNLTATCSLLQIMNFIRYGSAKILHPNLVTSDNDDNSRRAPWKRANVAIQCLMLHALQCKSHTMFKITTHYGPVIGDSIVCVCTTCGCFKSCGPPPSTPQTCVRYLIGLSSMMRCFISKGAQRKWCESVVVVVLK